MPGVYLTVVAAAGVAVDAATWATALAGAGRGTPTPGPAAGRKP